MMRAINKTDLIAGSTEIAISIYSAIDEETHFKQISACCNSAVNYKKVCSSCLKELDFSEIKKALAVGEDLKAVDTEKLKLESAGLRILGVISDDSEENGVFKNGNVWFIGLEVDKKNKAKTERNLIKYSYLREVLSNSKLNFIGIINQRGKEHIVLIKPYFKGLIGIGVYHLDRIRDISEIAGYSMDYSINKDTLNQMVEQFKLKEKVAIKNIENTRNKLIEGLLMIEESDKAMIKSNEQELNPLEICSF